MKPVWSWLIRGVTTSSNLLVMAQIYSLHLLALWGANWPEWRGQSTIMVTPLHSEDAISPALYEALRLSTRS